VIPQPRDQAEMNDSDKAADAAKSFRIVLRAVAVLALVVAAAVSALAAYILSLPWSYVSAVVVKKQMLMNRTQARARESVNIWQIFFARLS